MRTIVRKTQLNVGFPMPYRHNRARSIPPIWPLALRCNTRGILFHLDLCSSCGLPNLGNVELCILAAFQYHAVRKFLRVIDDTGFFLLQTWIMIIQFSSQQCRLCFRSWNATIFSYHSIHCQRERWVFANVTQVSFTKCNSYWLLLKGSKTAG
jgi:hypothetical protein